MTEMKPIGVVCMLSLAIASILLLLNLPSFFTETQIQILFSFPIIFSTLAIVFAIK